MESECCEWCMNRVNNAINDCSLKSNDDLMLHFWRRGENHCFLVLIPNLTSALSLKD